MDKIIIVGRKIFTLILFLSLAIGITQAQTAQQVKITATNLSGLWKGYNTQDAVNSYSSKYDFELYIYQKDNQVTGRSYATIGGIYAEMEIKGEIVDGGYLKFEETKVLDFKADEGMEWCVKKGVLRLIQDGDCLRLEGRWSGSTSFSNCVPGKVFLKKVEPKA